MGLMVAISTHGDGLRVKAATRKQTELAYSFASRHNFERPLIQNLATIQLSDASFTLTIWTRIFRLWLHSQAICTDTQSKSRRSHHDRTWLEPSMSSDIKRCNLFNVLHASREPTKESGIRVLPSLSSTMHPEERNISKIHNPDLQGRLDWAPPNTMANIQDLAETRSHDYLQA